MTDFVEEIMEEEPGGFDSDIFVTAPSEKYNCGICLSVLNDPRQCSNGHCFCKGCILKWLKKHTTCPYNCPLTAESLSRNLFVKDAIEENMPTYCISCDNLDRNKTEHCEWTGRLCDRTAHYEKDCGFILVSCPNNITENKSLLINCDVLPENWEKRKTQAGELYYHHVKSGENTWDRPKLNGCEEKVPRLQLEAHLKICLFSPAECEYCHQSLLRINLTQHYNECDSRMILCDNGCGITVPFKDLQTHKKQACPLQLFECELGKVGLCQDCPGRMTTADMLQHMNSKCELTRSAVVKIVNAIKTIPQSTVTNETNSNNNVLTKLRYEFKTTLTAIRSNKFHYKTTISAVSHDIVRMWVNPSAIQNGMEEHNIQLILSKLNYYHNSHVHHLAYEFPLNDILNDNSATGILSTEFSLLPQFKVQIRIYKLLKDKTKYRVSLYSNEKNLMEAICAQATILDFNNIVRNQTFTTEVVGKDDVWPILTESYFNKVVDRTDGKVKILMAVVNATKDKYLERPTDGAFSGY